MRQVASLLVCLALSPPALSDDVERPEPNTKDAASETEIAIGTIVSRMSQLTTRCSGPTHNFDGPQFHRFVPGVIEISHMRPPARFSPSEWENAYIISENVLADSVSYGRPSPEFFGCWGVKYECAAGSVCIGDGAAVMYARNPSTDGTRRVGEDYRRRSGGVFFFGAANEEHAAEVAGLFQEMIVLLQLQAANAED